MDTSTDSAIDLESMSTKEEAKIINPINKDAVHKICSGQVVLSLAIAVKELVENSLDSGATNIEIRLKDYGEELVEVLDNGSGVMEDNFAGLTLKYHTSKLRDFSDLLGVTTFGFRGEALSSLCALSSMAIVTRHNTAEVGTKLVFDNKGLITNQTACARQPGTTVSLSNLFSTLPVRQKEFHRNIKREFNKMTQLLYAYCLVAEGVKIVCTNQVNKGQKSTVLATQGGNVKDNIACIFGIKQAQSLMDLTPIYPDVHVGNIKETFFNNLENSQIETVDPVSDDKPLDVTSIKSDHELELSEDSNETQDDLISQKYSTQDSQSQKYSTQDSQSQKYSTQDSQSQNDMPFSSQFSTVSSNKYKNDRPFDFQSYISSCAHGSGRSSKDRQFFYVNSRPCEPTKIVKIVNEVYKSYNPHQSPFIYLNLKMKRSSVDVNVTPDKRKLFFDKEKYLLEIVKSSLSKLYENIPSTLKVENTKSDHSKIVGVSNKTQIDNQPRIFSSFLSQFSKSQSSQSASQTISKTTKDCKRKATSSLDNFVLKVSKTSDDRNDENVSHESDDIDDEDVSDLEVVDNNKTEESVVDDQSSIQVEEMVDDKEHDEEIDDCKETVFLGFSDNVSLSQVVDISEVVSNKKTISPEKSRTKKESKKHQVSVIVDSEFEKVDMERKLVNINTTIEEIKRQMLESCKIDDEKTEMLKKVKFRSEINPVFNKECEEELKKEISKDMFSQMKIVGQFNLGFIIAQLENDLFIIDQHATDEKYNFETLQKTTVLTNQRLVIPQSLELTGVNERVLMDSLEVFRINGFTFQIDEDAPPTKRVKLVTIPISKGMVFGKEDIDELLFMLQDSPNEVCRPSRLRAMFASRACRKSVMIGTALSKGDMRKLVDHMGIIDQPWNCPHGRPTIRHLINMELINTSY